MSEQRRRRGPMGGRGMAACREGKRLPRLHGKTVPVYGNDTNSVL